MLERKLRLAVLSSYLKKVLRNLIQILFPLVKVVLGYSRILSEGDFLSLLTNFNMDYNQLLRERKGESSNFFKEQYF